MKSFRRQAEPIEAVSETLEVVERANREIGITEPAYVDDCDCEARARNVVDHDEVLRLHRLDPVLDDVDATNAPARRPPDELDRRFALKPVELVQVRGRPKPGVEARSNERGNHHFLPPRRWRSADAKYAPHGLVQEPLFDQRSNLASR